MIAYYCNNTHQCILSLQDVKLLEMMKQTQRASRLEGSHNNLIDTIFSLSDVEDDSEAETDAKMQEMDSEFENEKKDLLDKGNLVDQSDGCMQVWISAYCPILTTARFIVSSQDESLVIP